MNKENVLLFLTPKTELSVFKEDLNVRQALEKMRAHSYMAIPVINKEGEYVGTITEGDLLWKIVDADMDMDELENASIKDIIRKNYTNPVKVDANMKELTSMIIEQNFVPVVDDRNILMGIVTRKNILKALLNDEA